MVTVARLVGEEQTIHPSTHSRNLNGVMMTTHEQIQKYMDELGWSTIHLARLTNIHHIKLQEILDGEKQPTMNQLMNIINKIILNYPQDQHWSIYHNIALLPVIGDKK
jgi:predicted transcriptional regulator